MRKFAATAVVGLFVVLVHSQASAATVTFTGNGSFINYSNCSGGLFGCSISNDKNVLDMSGLNNSTLTAVDIVNKSVETNASNVVIGRIDWVNNASYITDQDFNVTYKFELSFTEPNDAAASKTFSLNIKQLTNPDGDKIFDLKNAAIASLGPFDLDGVTVDNFHFGISGAGSYDPVSGLWKLKEHKTSSLLIFADFTEIAAPVPEPSTWAMLLLGFAGVGFAAYRRSRGAGALALG